MRTGRSLLDADGGVRTPEVGELRARPGRGHRAARQGGAALSSTVAPGRGDTLIRGATLINEGRQSEQDVLIRGDRIEQIGGSPRARGAVTEIDAGGKWLLPGLIDDQVHFREPGHVHKGNIARRIVGGRGRRRHQLHGHAQCLARHSHTGKTRRQVRRRQRTRLGELRLLPGSHRKQP